MTECFDKQSLENELRRRGEGSCLLCKNFDKCTGTQRKGSHRYCWSPLQLPTANLSQIMYDNVTSVEERLPKEKGYYLCFWSGENSPEGRWDVLNFDGKEFPWATLFPNQKNKVLKWLPLPRDERGD